MTVQVVYVSADIGGSGIELKSPENSESRPEGTLPGLEMVEPNSIAPSPTLCTDIRYWQKWYDGVFHLVNEEKVLYSGTASMKSGCIWPKGFRRNWYDSIR